MAKPGLDRILDKPEISCKTTASHPHEDNGCIETTGDIRIFIDGS
jgi:hypothetical protein